MGSIAAAKVEVEISFTSSCFTAPLVVDVGAERRAARSGTDHYHRCRLFFKWKLMLDNVKRVGLIKKGFITGSVGKRNVPERTHSGIRTPGTSLLSQVEHSPRRGSDSFVLYWTTATRICNCFGLVYFLKQK